jgi:hypothetical protein
MICSLHLEGKPFIDRKPREEAGFFHPKLLGRLSPEEERETPLKPGAPYSVMIAIILDLTELDKQAKTDQARTSLDQFRARYGMINLSRLRRKLEENLVAFFQVRT